MLGGERGDDGGRSILSGGQWLGISMVLPMKVQSVVNLVVDDGVRVGEGRSLVDGGVRALSSTETMVEGVCSGTGGDGVGHGESDSGCGDVGWIAFKLTERSRVPATS